MSTTSIATGHALTIKKINDLAFREYVRSNPFNSYMGTDPTKSIIVVKEDLTKSKGDAVTVPFVAKLSGSAVTGETAMEGSEEAMSFYGHVLTLNQFKNAVRLNGSLTERRSPLDMRMEAKGALSDWMANLVKTQFIEAFATISGTVYGSASEATKDAWLAANADRVLFGATRSNIAANDHSAALLNVDTTSDKLSCAVISLAKRMAKTANPKITPIKVEDGTEWYVLFADELAIRDLKADTTWSNAQRDSMPRGSENPLFTGAVGAWDGVIVREVEDTTILSAVGASSADVAVNVLCGAGALGLAHGGYSDGSKIVLTPKLFDYDEQYGVQVKSTHAYGKLQFNSKQNGVVTVYTSALAD